MPNVIRMTSLNTLAELMYKRWLRQATRCLRQAQAPGSLPKAPEKKAPEAELVEATGKTNVPVPELVEGTGAKIKNANITKYSHGMLFI
jgi:hypothetical protein